MSGRVEALRAAERAAGAAPDDAQLAETMRAHRCRASLCCGHADEPFDHRRPPPEAEGARLQASSPVMRIDSGSSTGRAAFELHITGSDTEVHAALAWLVALFGPAWEPIPERGELREIRFGRTVAEVVFDRAPLQDRDRAAGACASTKSPASRSNPAARADGPARRPAEPRAGRGRPRVGARPSAQLGAPSGS